MLHACCHLSPTSCYQRLCPVPVACGSFWHKLAFAMMVADSGPCPTAPLLIDRRQANYLMQCAHMYMRRLSKMCMPTLAEMQSRSAVL